MSKIRQFNCERTLELLEPIIKLGFTTAKNTTLMDVIREDKEVLEDLIRNDVATAQIEFFHDIHGKDFKCPTCGNSVKIHCPRGICGYCNSTINITSSHSDKLCSQCAGQKKKECHHPDSGEGIHFRI